MFFDFGGREYVGMHGTLLDSKMIYLLVFLLSIWIIWIKSLTLSIYLTLIKQKKVIRAEEMRKDEITQHLRFIASHSPGSCVILVFSMVFFVFSVFSCLVERNDYYEFMIVWQVWVSKSWRFSSSDVQHHKVNHQFFSSLWVELLWVELLRKAYINLYQNSLWNGLSVGIAAKCHFQGFFYELLPSHK